MTMIKAVLLDLDNTLLRNPDLPFAEQFLGLIEDYFADVWQFQGMADLFLRSLRAMNEVRDVSHTNADILKNLVTQTTGKSRKEIDCAFTTFYSEAYPALKNCIEPIPEANELVDYLYSQGYALVISTNPIYPAEAVWQRLTWAELPYDPKFYWLVTHADNMHFTKLNPAYYGEILARIGMEPDECIMVGDSIGNDIIPAATVGLHTYRIVPDKLSHTEGSLTDFIQQVTSDGWRSSFFPQTPIPTMIEPQLRGNVGALFGMLTDVKDHFWMQHPDPNEWSILQIVCHLWESEIKVQRRRLQRILEEDNPFLVAPKAPPGSQSPPCHPNGHEIARRFALERAKTLDFLQNLSFEDWQRPARHSIFGATSLLEMALFTAQHDRLHLNQLCQTLGKCE
jgi:FMN phosphatase YigB (HAD superfamily)